MTEGVDILQIFANDKRVVTYRPEWRGVCGSVTGAILMGQILYWWDRSGRKPFYKFRAPCSHELYRMGDSWCEELGFSGREFDTALKRIGKKAKQKDIDKIKAESGAFVLYWTSLDRLTYYDVNATVLKDSLTGIYVIAESAITCLTNPQLPNRGKVILNTARASLTENTDRDYGKGSPSPFHWKDFKALLPAGVTLSGQLKAKIERALTKGNRSISEIRETLAYSTANCRDLTKYPGYFGKCLDGGHAAGFLDDSMDAAKADADESARLAKAEKVLLAMTDDELVGLSGDIEAADYLPFLEKHEMWNHGPKSEKIRANVVKFIARQMKEGTE